MQRVRMSLPYFKQFGWEAEVVTVDPCHSDMAVDPLLKESFPPDVPLHYVGALPKRWTQKIGLGSIALRSLPFFRGKVNRLLREKRFDLIYFSTTQFPVCVLGDSWQKRFGVPYVIDMQDPWHSDYYEKNPQEERPPKYWFSYRLNKWLEPIAMKSVGGLIAVSAGYLETLGERYPQCRQVPQRTITFGAFEQDFGIAYAHKDKLPSVLPQNPGKINIVYIGRGGKDMQPAVRCLFGALQAGLASEPELFERLHLHFIGTSYASAGQGVATIAPLAESMGVGSSVTEITDRIPFYQTLNTLADAAALFVPGSTDAQYTASKIYPYVLAGKPLLAYFHPASSVVPFLRRSGAGTVLTFEEDPQAVQSQMVSFLRGVASQASAAPVLNASVVEAYSARTMTQQQCELFDAVIG